MAKERLITIRVNENTYDDFQRCVERHNSNMSRSLRDYIFNCIKTDSLSTNTTILKENTMQELDSNLIKVETVTAPEPHRIVIDLNLKVQEFKRYS